MGLYVCKSLVVIIGCNTSFRCMRSTQHEGAFETNFLLECTGSKVNYLAFGIKKGPEAGVRYFFEICPAAKSEQKVIKPIHH